MGHMEMEVGAYLVILMLTRSHFNPWHQCEQLKLSRSWKINIFYIFTSYLLISLCFKIFPMCIIISRSQNQFFPNFSDLSYLVPAINRLISHSLTHSLTTWFSIAGSSSLRVGHFWLTRLANEDIPIYLSPLSASENIGRHSPALLPLFIWVSSWGCDRYTKMPNSVQPGIGWLSF